MKVRKLLATSALAYTAYKLIKHRQEIYDNYTEKDQTLSNIRKHTESIKEQLATVAAKQEELRTVVEKLTYKGRVFSHETQAHLKEIKKILKH